MRKSMRVMRGVLLLMVGAALLAGISGMEANAQTFRGTILGTVTDSSGGAVAGAAVKARNVATGLERTTNSADDGSYAIPELPIGSYDVTVETAGFQTSVTTGIAVEVAHDRRVDVVLKAGDLAQRVEVSGETVTQVETTNNTLGGSFTSKDIVDLPINGRDFDKLLIMVPGATGDPSGAADSPGSFGQFSSNGNRGRSNNFLLDGTDMNDSYRNLSVINQGAVFAIPGTILPVESIAEVRVLSNMEAEYGRSSGAVVNIVTKSGTNTVHGSAFEYFRNDHLNARNFFNTVGPKDAFRNNQFGFAAGGPIVKDKTFWYAAYEGQREGLGLTSLNVVPTLQNFADAFDASKGGIAGGNPAACTTTIFACVTGQPSGVVNPVTLNLFNLCNTAGKCSGGKLPWPTPNLATPVGSNNNVSSDLSRNDVDSLIIKIDHNFNQHHSLTGRYFYGRSEQSLPLGAAGGNNIPNTNTFSPTNVHLGSFSYVSVISNNLVNELRFGFNRFHEDFLSADAGTFGNPNVTLGLNTGLGTIGPGQVVAPNKRDFGLPIFAVGSFSTLASSRFSNPKGRVTHNYQLLDNFSWKLAKHDVKFGYEERYTPISTFQDVNARGRLKFLTLADFLAGNVTNGGSILYGKTDRETRQLSYGFYVQDSIRLNPRVTANLGLRWDYFGLIREANGQFSSYDAVNGLRFLNLPYGRDFDNFAPRVSLAWDVFGKGRTVVRSGFGVFYDSFSHDFFTGQIFFNSAVALGPAYNPIGGNAIFTASPVGTLTPAGGGPVFNSSSGGLASATSDVTSIGNLRTPYIYNYSLNIQQQLLPDTVLEIGYVGTAGHKLQRVRDINQPSPAAITAADIACAGGSGAALTSACTSVSGPLSGGATFTVAGIPRSPGIVNLLETESSSNYNSLQVSLTQRNWHHWSNQLSYTWSHSIDDASDGQDYVPNAAQPNDSTNPSINRGNSNFDTRNHFVLSSTYDMPKWGALGRMGEGYQFSAVISLVSGHPFHFIDSGDNWDGTGEFFTHPDVVGPIKLNNSDPGHYLDLSVNNFFVPCNLDGSGGTGAANCLAGSRHIGNLRRNALVGPAFRDVDFAFSKDTRISERYHILLRADFFNLFNHPNFTNPLLPAFAADLGSFASVASVPSGVAGVNRGQLTGIFPLTATVDTGIGNPILGGGGPRSIQFSLKLLF